MSFDIRRRRPLLAALVVLGALAPGLAFAAGARIQRPETDAPPAVAPVTPTAPSSRSIPVTPTVDAMREISPGVYEGIVPFQLADGTWMIHLDERFHAYSVIRRGDGGRFAGTCVHGASGLARWRAAAVPTVTDPATGTTQVTKWEAK